MSGTADPAAALAALIVTQSPVGGVALAVDTNLFVGPERQVRAGVPPFAVFCSNLQGPPLQPYLGEAKDYAKHQVRVVVRSAPAQFAAGEQLARELIAALQRRAATGFLTTLVQQSSPEHLGEDAERQHRFQFAAEMWRVG